MSMWLLCNLADRAIKINEINEFIISGNHYRWILGVVVSRDTMDTTYTSQYSVATLSTRKNAVALMEWIVNIAERRWDPNNPGPFFINPNDFKETVTNETDSAG